jgi:hypothetical protein
LVTAFVSANTILRDGRSKIERANGRFGQGRSVLFQKLKEDYAKLQDEYRKVEYLVQLASGIDFLPGVEAPREFTTDSMQQLRVPD